MNTAPKMMHLPDVTAEKVARLPGIRAPASTLSVSVPAVIAASATAVSLCTATYAGWQRGGTLVEHLMSVALGGVAILYVHLLPVCWSALRSWSRFVAFALWFLGLLVTLYGQVTFIIVSEQDAGTQRAATVPAIAMQPAATFSPVRSPTEIAREVAKISGELAREESHRCEGGCLAVKERRPILMAQLAELNTEAREARRRELEEDRRYERADRNEALRTSLRSDPVASIVASWLGTVESRLELTLAIACAVVLEGTAIVGWVLVSLASRRVPIVSDHVPRVGKVGVLGQDRDLSVCDLGVPTALAVVAVPTIDAFSEGKERDSGASSDNSLLNEIHRAVMAGRLKPTQAAIRRFLKCGQSKAGKLKREYLLRFGGADTHGEWRNAF